MRFVSELQRRNVIKVCILYAVAGWLLVRLVGLATVALAAPAWVMKAFFIVLLIGFPVAIIFSWVYELTPHGLKLETVKNMARSYFYPQRLGLSFCSLGY